MVKTLPFNGEGAVLIPAQRAKIPRAPSPKSQNMKQKQYYNKFNKDFKKRLVYIKNREKESLMRGYQWRRKRGGYNSIEEVAGFHVQLDVGMK